MKRYSYISNPEIYLKDYLTLSDADKGRELAFHNPYTFLGFLYPDYTEIPGMQEKFAEFFPDIAADINGFIPVSFEDLQEMDDPAGFIESVLPLFSDSDLEEFFAQVEHEFSNPEDPSFLFMDYTGIVKNQWLIHFTEDAEAIAANGFEFGAPEYVSLGLTTHYNDSYRKSEKGYNFAYLLSDFMSYGKGRGFRFQIWLRMCNF